MPILQRVCSLPLSAIALLSGVSAFQQLAELPAPYWAWLCLPLPLLAWRFRMLLPLAIAAAGFLWAWLYAAAVLSAQLPAEAEGRDLTAEGVIAGLPESDPHRVHFEFIVTSLLQDGRALSAPGRIALSWYYPAVRLHPGERWRLKLRLKRPHGLRNPGGFDYEAWLFRHRIRATGYVRDDRTNRRLQPGGLGIDRLRQALAQGIATALGDDPYTGIIQALAIGVRAGIDREQWSVLTATGTNHLVAISGLHVGLVAGLGFFLGRWLWSRWPRLTLRWPAPKAGAAAGLGAALLYAALAGFSIPTQRTVIMVLVVMLAMMAGRASRGGQVLAAALLAVLVWDPLAVLEPGFWLSFAAVAVIFFGMGRRRAPHGMWWKWGRAQLLVGLGLAPLLLILFQRLSIVAPVANLVAVPWVTLVVVPLTLAGTLLILPWPWAGAWVLKGAALAMAGLWPLLSFLGHTPVAQWLQAAPPAWSYAPALLGTIWLLAPSGMPARWLGMVLLAPMVLVNPAHPAAGEARFTLLDVGQGLSAVVQTARHTLVFDTGPATEGGFDAGSAVVVPFLRHVGLGRVDTLIVSHGDMDHRGGAPAVLAQAAVARVLTSVPHKIDWREGRPETCEAGQHWTWDGVDFELLYPLHDQPYRGNDASCVLRVRAGGHSVLLPGDIERRSEALLVEGDAQQLPADIVVAPHHGSATSSTAAFLAAIHPAYVLFAVGYRNRYGFPRAEVVRRYAEAGVQRLDSAREGAITFRLGAAPLEPHSYRREARRYWNAR